MATGVHAPLALLLILTVALLSASPALAAHGMRHRRARAVHARGLKQFRPTPTFPYLRCGNFSSRGLPYYLEGPTWSLDADTQIATYSFRIGFKGPAPSGAATPCYSALEKSAYKLMLHIYTACEPALEVAGYNASLNGKTKAMHVYQYPQGSTLAITKLDLNSTTADGAVVSFTAAAPCNQPVYLFKPNAAKQVPIEYSITESAKHQCCPRSV